MTIVVLAGGTSTERDVSLISGSNIYQMFIRDSTGSALGEDGRDKAVAVHTFALNGGKEEARLHLPAVNDNACDFDGF